MTEAIISTECSPHSARHPQNDFKEGKVGEGKMGRKRRGEKGKGRGKEGEERNFLMLFYPKALIKVYYYNRI